ncbi:GAF domain-containing protein [Streptomyces olivochromogenes]|uniref:Membrane protein n=1 Tax=Streptomyces olivochromogenes TaxID=1963 RepID=A0A250VVF4_STROL|nr:GAF domain-containing protein [Streptomyces olivochromogenes]KUN35620.1 hypothetical protein AQJ27_48205 [Streptomyces olivochromogenes]GAX57940.1 membrane protein [Streptomyces olivochromogenes]
MGASQDIFHTADKLARNALAELADIVAVEVSELMLHGEANTPGPFCTSAPLRRAAFQSAPGAELRPAYAVGEVVRIPAATPYRQSLTDLRPRLIRDLKRERRWLARESALARAVRAAQAHSLIVIPLVAQDVVLGLVGLYRRADSAPFDGGDLEGPPSSRTALRGVWTSSAAACKGALTRVSCNAPSFPKSFRPSAHWMPPKGTSRRMAPAASGSTSFPCPARGWPWWWEQHKDRAPPPPSA